MRTTPAKWPARLKQQRASCPATWATQQHDASASRPSLAGCKAGRPVGARLAAAGVFGSGRGVGGGIYSYAAAPALTACVVSENAAVYGGGMYTGFHPHYQYTVNSIFHKNTATGAGNGVFNQNANPNYINCTFFDNGSHNESGATFIQNCIFWGVFSDIINISGSTNTTTTTTITTDPKFINPTNPKGADGKWQTADDGLRPGCSSPAFNAGSGVVGVTTDILGASRNQLSATDRGAYESAVWLAPLVPSVSIAASAKI